MAEQTQVKAKTCNKKEKAVAKKTSRKPAAPVTEEAQTQAKTGRPAYLQKKMAVSTPGDAHEQEADRVADEVSRMPTGLSRTTDEGVQRAAITTDTEASEQSLQPSLGRKEDNTIATKISCMSETEDVAPALMRTEVDEAHTKLQRMEDEVSAMRIEDDTLHTKAFREAAEPDSEQAFEEGPAVDDETERKIDALRGMGDLMADDIRTDMEEKIGANFSSVRIHTNGDADQLAKQLNARAFTVGSDIFFAAGEYAPETEKGRKLLAHELTHVVQQGGGANRKIYRAVSPVPSVVAGSNAEKKLNELTTLVLPPIKYRHEALYSGHGARRKAGYKRDTSETQVSVWKQHTNLTEDTIEAKIRAQLRREDPDAEFTRPTSPYGQVRFTLPGRTEPISGQWRGIRNQLIIPDWDRQGNYLESRSDKFQVDHMIELQVFGDESGNAGNVIGNLELLKGSPNSSSGSTIKNKIYERVYNFLGAQNANFGSLASSTRSTRRRSFLADHTITFDEIVRGEGRSGNDTDWWTRSEIEEGEHLDIIQPQPSQRLEGSSGNFVLASGPAGVEISRYTYTDLNFSPTGRRKQKAMAGIHINSFELNTAVEQGGVDADVGVIHAVWDLPRDFRSDEEVVIPLKGIAPYCAGPGEIPGLNTDFLHLSPVSFSALEIRNGHLYSEGSINTSLPLLANTPISIVLDGSDLRFQIEYSPGMVSLPIPGLTIDDSSIALFYSTSEGFGGSGELAFSINQLGSGNFVVEASTQSGFSASGEFDFDSDLFDRARINIWYRDNQFGGLGEIGIDQADKIRGIRSANLHVGFSENEFNAEGVVQPDIPGVQEAGLEINYTEEGGLTIGGNLLLNSETPGIESGSIDVEVNKLDDVWKVAAIGRAVPSITGLSSELLIDYDDGAFTAEVTAQYAHGMLSGELTAGVTNRTVGEDGQLSDIAEPDSPLIVYGGGSLTIQIAPWLKGTAGVEFSPDGELTVIGEIALPDELEIFARREINKSIFNIAVQAPVFPGIVAEVGGGLGLTAGIGPGVIDELSLSIEYNPAHEEDTTITGDAHLNIPADAGLRLAVRAGIGLSIFLASATGGLEIGGTLGIEGAAEAGVHVEWTPSTGLHIDAHVGVHAQPAFTFDIGGYISVRALGFSVYDETFEFASYTFGSDYRFGLSLPIHYREGEPFDISLDDIEFDIPDIDTDQILRGLIARVA